jgi:hypothetical protein
LKVAGDQKNVPHKIQMHAHSRYFANIFCVCSFWPKKLSALLL